MIKTINGLGVGAAFRKTILNPNAIAAVLTVPVYIRFWPLNERGIQRRCKKESECDDFLHFSRSVKLGNGKLKDQADSLQINLNAIAANNQIRLFFFSFFCQSRELF